MGSAMIRYLLKLEEFEGHITNLDRLTYAGSLKRVAEVEQFDRYHFVEGDIQDGSSLREIHKHRAIEALLHFAAETHVDRSIVDPKLFFETNVMGTLSLLEFVREHGIPFHHISTDEVYGALSEEGSFHEESPYRPNSPYAASKASSDHLVRAYIKTYGIKATLSHASNNYGPYQHPEKLIPLMIERALARKPLPVYGTGQNVREWLYVEDHARAIWTILTKGKSGEVYNIGGGEEMKNLELIDLILTLLQEITKERSYKDLITFVPDRLGHDFRYALEGKKMEGVGFRPRVSLKEGLKETIHSILKEKR